MSDASERHARMQDPTPANAANIVKALEAFGAPVGQVTTDDFSRPGIVFQMGLPPVRIDVLTELSGLTFADAWPGRTQVEFGPLTMDVIGRDDFIKNKRATGRARDLSDIEALGGSSVRGGGPSDSTSPCGPQPFRGPPSGCTPPTSPSEY